MLIRSRVALSLLFIAMLGCSSEEPSSNTSAPANASAGEDQTLVGGYSKATADDAIVTSVAEFAVTEESKKGTKISLKSISSAETQVVAGTNYKLVIVVDEGGTEKTVEVIVYQDLQQTRTLTSWKTI